MVRIRELHWRQDREDHMIQRHGVYPVEVEEAIFYDRHGYFEKAGPAQRNPQETVYEHFGRTIERRYLMTVLLYEEGDEAMPVTSREMDQAERRRYERRS